MLRNEKRNKVKYVGWRMCQGINKIIKSNKNEELECWDFRNYTDWKNCVKNDVIKYKEKYLVALLNNNEPIKYII